jgi:hypothetical protein
MKKTLGRSTEKQPSCDIEIVAQYLPGMADIGQNPWVSNSKRVTFTYIVRQRRSAVTTPLPAFRRMTNWGKHYFDNVCQISESEE